MIKNYFKTAYRNVCRHTSFSLINALGLTAGLTSFFLIYLYVNFETSYDRFNAKADRISRLVCDTRSPAGTSSGSVTPAAIGAVMKADLPEVEKVVRLSKGNIEVRRGSIKFQEDKLLIADSTIFSVFSFPLLKGDPGTALQKDFSLVLSETSAKKYFGSSDPMGKTVIIGGGKGIPATITGIMKDIPENSHIKAEMILSNSFEHDLDTNWTGLFYYTYILLKQGTDRKALEAKLPSLVMRHLPQQVLQGSISYSFFLEPLRDVYLRSKRGGMEGGSISNVYIFTAVSFFILIIAGINFVNLSTARAADRAKEVGVRKVTGATRAQLIGQFMTEALLIVFMAFLLTTLLSATLLPLFNQLAGKTLSRGIFEQPTDILVLFLAAAGIGVVAGIYPALVLSGYRAARVLKGRFIAGGNGIRLRKALVITQYTLSVGLITATIVIYSQLHFMQRKDLGFRKDQTLIIDDPLRSAESTFKQEITKLPGVIAASFSGTIPGGERDRGADVEPLQIENGSAGMQTADIEVCQVDFDFIRQFNIKMEAGRPFSKNFSTDTAQALVLNETAVKLFGYSSPGQAIGKRFIQGRQEGKIIGVMKDFHFRGLQENIQPLCLRIMPVYNYNYLSIRLSAGNLPATMNAIEKKFSALMPDTPFNYFFLDEFFDRQYRAETRFGRLFFYFAALAIFISCLGLFGLVSYSIIQRTKEIGIRKVLGASVSGIVGLLSIDFLKLVFISMLIASPLAWLVMNKWLQGFAYRIPIRWWFFSVGAALALLVALLTISIQTIKAAIANPIESLKTE